jgi:hypothetical protein
MLRKAVLFHNKTVVFYCIYVDNCIDKSAECHLHRLSTLSWPEGSFGDWNRTPAVSSRWPTTWPKGCVTGLLLRLENPVLELKNWVLANRTSLVKGRKHKNKFTNYANFKAVVKLTTSLNLCSLDSRDSNKVCHYDTVKSECHYCAHLGYNAISSERRQRTRCFHLQREDLGSTFP